jgi:hypothetical protein
MINPPEMTGYTEEHHPARTGWMLTSFWEPQLQLISTVARNGRLRAVGYFTPPADQEILIAPGTDFSRRRHRYWIAGVTAFVFRDHAVKRGNPRRYNRTAARVAAQTARRP